MNKSQKPKFKKEEIALYVKTLHTMQHNAGKEIRN